MMKKECCCVGNGNNIKTNWTNIVLTLYQYSMSNWSHWLIDWLDQMPLFRRSVHLYLLKRHCREATLFGLDKSRWYRLVDDNDQMLSDELRGKFIECHLDLGTQRFIDACYYQSKCLFRSLWILIMRSILKLFISSTSICGLLNCGRMFVFSDEQIEKFCFDTLDMQSEMVDNGGRSRRQNRGTLLDIGAGDGNVTAKLAKYFNRTYVTELSRTMQNRLIKRAFHLLDVDEWHEHEFRFDMISCLNVLDRFAHSFECLFVYLFWILYWFMI